MILPILAQASGDGLVRQLWSVLIIGICIAIIWWVGRWFIVKLGVPPIGMTIWNGLFILLGAIALINFLLGLGGHPFIRW